MVTLKKRNWAVFGGRCKSSINRGEEEEEEDEQINLNWSAEVISNKHNSFFGVRPGKREILLQRNAGRTASGGQGSRLVHRSRGALVKGNLLDHMGVIVIVN